MANAKGMKPTAVEFTNNYVTRIDYDSGTNPIYIGKADLSVASATDTAVWQIFKVTWDGNDNPTLIQYADNNETFDNVWDDRAALSYG